MYRHHADTITNIADKLKTRNDVLAVLVGGSIAHGFERENSDVDIMIVISDEQYEAKKAQSDLWYCDVESCTYEGGYVDGKFISPGFMKLVARQGSEPARFAFDGAITAWSKIDDLQALVDSITAYPVREKPDKIRHFYGQLDGWRWYCREALNHGNRYLLNHSICNIVLFGGRLILAHNETLYPYHKWFLRVLEAVPLKPQAMMANIDRLLRNPEASVIESFCDDVFGFADWGFQDMNFADYFIKNNELNWLDGCPPIADL